MQIAIGFITEALSTESSEKQHVLMIGLGGGSSSSFLSILHNLDLTVRWPLFPFCELFQVETTVVEIDEFMVKLAEEYFNHLTEPGVTNVIVQDGVQFVEDAVEGGEFERRRPIELACSVRRYHSILLDACYAVDETSTGRICPIKQFLEEKAIRNLYDLLEDNGRHPLPY